MDLSREEFLSYASNQLSQERRDEIDLYFKDNPLERKALEGAQTYNQKASFEDLMAKIEERLPAIEDSTLGPTNTSSSLLKKSLPLILLIAALTALLIYLNKPQQVAPPLEYASYFEAYPDVVTSTVRGDAADNSQQVISAFNAYNEGDFQKATTLFTALVNIDPVDERFAFYHAISLTGAGEYKDALKIWIKLSENPGFPYMDGLIWNKALCHIGLNQTDEARYLLKQVIEENLYKKTEAQELLILLNK